MTTYPYKKAKEKSRLHQQILNSKNQFSYGKNQVAALIFTIQRKSESPERILSVSMFSNSVDKTPWMKFLKYVYIYSFCMISSYGAYAKIHMYSNQMFSYSVFIQCKSFFFTRYFFLPGILKQLLTLQSSRAIKQTK